MEKRRFIYPKLNRLDLKIIEKLHKQSQPKIKFYDFLMTDAVKELIQHEDLTIAEKILTDFNFVIERLKVCELEDVLDDYFWMAQEKISEEMHEWCTFFRRYAHIFRRYTQNLPVHRLFFQVATEDAISSPVTKLANAYIRSGNMDWKWLRKEPIPENILPSYEIATFEGHDSPIIGVLEIKEERYLSWDLDRLYILRTKSGRVLKEKKMNFNIAETLDLEEDYILCLGEDTYVVFDYNLKEIERDTYKNNHVSRVKKYKNTNQKHYLSDQRYILYDDSKTKIPTIVDEIEEKTFYLPFSYDMHSLAVLKKGYLIVSTVDYLSKVVFKKTGELVKQVWLFENAPYEKKTGVIKLRNGDYITWNHEDEAKYFDLKKGIAQNLAQLYDSDDDMENYVTGVKELRSGHLLVNRSNDAFLLNAQIGKTQEITKLPSNAVLDQLIELENGDILVKDREGFLHRIKNGKCTYSEFLYINSILKLDRYLLICGERLNICDLEMKVILEKKQVITFIKHLEGSKILIADREGVFKLLDFDTFEEAHIKNRFPNLKRIKKNTFFSFFTDDNAYNNDIQHYFVVKNHQIRDFLKDQSQCELALSFEQEMLELYDYKKLQNGTHFFMCKTNAQNSYDFYGAPHYAFFNPKKEPLHSYFRVKKDGDIFLTDENKQIHCKTSEDELFLPEPQFIESEKYLYINEWKRILVFDKMGNLIQTLKSGSFHLSIFLLKDNQLTALVTDEEQNWKFIQYNEDFTQKTEHKAFESYDIQEDDAQKFWKMHLKEFSRMLDRADLYVKQETEDRICFWNEGLLKRLYQWDIQLTTSIKLSNSDVILWTSKNILMYWNNEKKSLIELKQYPNNEVYDAVLLKEDIVLFFNGEVVFLVDTNTFSGAPLSTDYHYGPSYSAKSNAMDNFIKKMKIYDIDETLS